MEKYEPVVINVFSPSNTFIKFLKKNEKLTGAYKLSYESTNEPKIVIEMDESDKNLLKNIIYMILNEDHIWELFVGEDQYIR